MAQYTKQATVSIQCGTTGATIYYTTDGNTPSDSSTQYSDSFVMYKNCTVKAIGIKDGLTDSDIATSEIEVILPTPVLQANANGDEATVTITNSADYASNYGTVTFYYTDDGSAPAVDEGKIFTSGKTFTKNCTVKVIAVATGNVNSVAGEVAVSTVKVDTPVITVV